jgi:hypothetical protein
LIVNIQFSANSKVFDWANNILDTYPKAHAIVATYAYIDKRCKYSSWAENLRDSVLSSHPNVFMTLSGHFQTNLGNRTKVGNRDELMFDRQSTDGNIGAATLRILTFDIVKGLITVKTYVLYEDHFLTDSSSQFTLETSFYNDLAQTPEPSVVTILLMLLVISVCILVYRGRLMRRYRIPRLRNQLRV